MSDASPSSGSAPQGWQAWSAALRALWGRLAGLAARTVMLPAAAAVALPLLFLAWSCERGARLQQTLETEQIRQKAQDDAARLEAHAAATLREARAQHEAAMRALANRRDRLEREAADLRARLATLQRQEAVQTAEVAALPLPQVVQRLSARLGEAGIRDLGLGIREITGPRDSRLGDKAESKIPVLQANERKPARDSELAKPNSGIGNQQLAIGNPQPPVPGPQPPAPSTPVLALTEAGARAAETAFLQLDACRAASAVKDQELANCRESVRVHQSAIQQQDNTLDKLNAALADKDQLLAKRDEACRAELKLARGTRRARFFAALKYVAAGVLLGVLLR
jgi:hypothetical protein